MNPSKKSEPEPQLYEQADNTPTSPAPSIEPGGQPYPVEEPTFKTLGIAGRRAQRAEAAAA